jgi:hypothetical protein
MPEALTRVDEGEKMESSVDERDSGTLCGRCGMRYRVDVMVSDELWAKIHNDNEHLCGPCVVRSLEAISENDFYDLQHGSINEFKSDH